MKMLNGELVTLTKTNDRGNFMLRNKCTLAASFWLHSGNTNYVIKCSNIFKIIFLTFKSVISNFKQIEIINQ